MIVGIAVDDVVDGVYKDIKLIKKKGRVQALEDEVERKYSVRLRYISWDPYDKYRTHVLYDSSYSAKLTHACISEDVDQSQHELIMFQHLISFTVLRFTRLPI